MESCITKGMEVLVFVVLAASAIDAASFSDFEGSTSVSGGALGGGLCHNNDGVLGTKSG